MSEFERFVDNELVFIRKYIRDLPHQLLIAFAREFEDLTEDEIRNRQKAIYEMYQLSTNASSINIELALTKEVEIIFKPESYVILPSGQVIMFTKGNIGVITHINELGSTREDIENKLSDWMYAVVRQYKGRRHGISGRATLVKAIEIESLGGNVDTKNAERILKDYDLTPLEILVASFGVQPTKEAMRLYLPRLLGLFYYNGMPIHVIQLTNTDSGKTYFGVRCEFTFNYTHFSEFPSPARLIYDARTYSKGAVFTSQGIVIDEIDKINKQRFDEAYQPLNTGLENGIWRRGVQTTSGISLEGYRLIPFILFGNITQGEQPLYITADNTRDTILSLLDERTGLNTYSFVERFAICDVVYEKIPISKYLIIKNGVVGSMRDSILRGLIKLIEERIPQKYIDETDKVTGRFRRHSEAVYNVITALLNTEPDEDLIREIVIGEKTFTSLLSSEEVKEELMHKQEEIPITEVDMTRYM